LKSSRSRPALPREACHRPPAAVAIWLLLCCAGLAGMVLLGGLTRLTHSGLSMVEWEPLVGAVPPLSTADWLVLFGKYQQTPEYLTVNRGLSLDGFKSIFWLEYIHRLWGRALGLVFLVPLLGFAHAGAIGRALALRLAGLFVLGALQGAMGWYMVKSGLVADPAVSPYRLTAHLGLAVLIHAGMLWTALDILAAHRSRPRPAPTALPGGVLMGLLGLIAATILFGGLVAGLHAGLVYNTFPLMDGHLLPDLSLPEGWSSLFEDVTVVQFIHRSLAETTLAATLAAWAVAWSRRQGPLPLAIHALAAAALLQVGLGVATLLLRVPVWLAVTHQSGALVLLSAALWALHAVRE